MPEPTPVHFVPGIETDEDELRKPCAPVKTVREGLAIARDLWAMLERNNRRAVNQIRRHDGKQPLVGLLKPGIGLAAPQIGIHKRVCVLDLPSGKVVMVNPEIIGFSSARAPFTEGCLSIPGRTVDTHRHFWVTVQCLNWKEPRTFGPQRPTDPFDLFVESVCAQHEIAHVYGKLIQDFERDDYPAPPLWNEWK